MFSEYIILQSAGSLSVAVLALLMVIVQALFFIRKPQSTWYAWSAAISFSALLYSIGIFLEYNTPQGPINRFSGLLELTAIICLIHCLYGFTFSYLGIASKRYHPVAGVFHGLVLILLWSTNYLVADTFTEQNFIWLKSPYIEPALGPLGPLFVVYAAAASVTAIIVWIRHKRTDPNHRIAYIIGMSVWILLGVHDGLASLGVPALQYLMEYGFLGSAVVVLWVVFNNHLEIAAEEKYRAITEFANDCIMVIQDGNMVFGNQACCDVLGRPLTDSSPKDFLDIMVSEDREMLLEHSDTVLRGGSVPASRTVRIQRPDGKHRFVEIALSLIQYRNRTAVLAVSRDITEHKQAEERLRQQTAEMQLILDSVPALIFCKDANDRFTLVNKAAADQLKLSKEEVIGKTIDDILPEQAEATKRNDREVIETGKSKINVVESYTTPDGLRWAQTGKVPYRDSSGKVIGLIGVSVDITERKKSEEELKRREKELGMITENMPGLVSYVDADGCYRFVNSQYEQWFGLSREEIIGKHYSEIIGNDTYKKIQRYVEEALSGKHVQYEETIPYKSWGTRWINARYVPDIDENGSVKGFFALITDFTERKKVEEALRVSEESYRELANSITNVFFAMDKDLRYVYWNKASEELTGILEKDAIGKSLYEIFPDTPETRRAEKIYRAVLKKQKPMSFVNEYTLAGKRFFFDITAYPSEKGLSVFVKDIADQKKAEEELEKSQEQLRNLAAHLQSVREEERSSIAREIHDELGASLTGLKMDLSWLAEKIPKEESLLEKIQTMINLTVANINTVRRISAELRPGLLDVLGLAAALEWQAEEFRNRTGVKCKIKIDPEETPLDKNLSTDLFRIFQELLTNVARHAQATRVTGSFKKKKNYLELTVRDNGKGITGEQISDPTSFGLIGIRERIHPWRGKLAIKGLANKGTTVTVRVPS
jgi:PAS domain S-box-containing protein